MFCTIGKSFKTLESDVFNIFHHSCSVLVDCICESESKYLLVSFVALYFAKWELTLFVKLFHQKGSSKIEQNLNNYDQNGSR